MSTKNFYSWSCTLIAFKYTNYLTISTAKSLLGLATGRAAAVTEEKGDYIVPDTLATIAAGATMTVDVAGQKVQLTTTNPVTAGDTLAATAANLQTDLQTAITDAMAAQELTNGKEGYINPADVTVTAENSALKIEGPLGTDITFDESDLAIALGLNPSAKPAAEEKVSGSMILQIGANEGQAMSFNIEDMSAKALGVDGDNINLSTQEGVQKSIANLDTAAENTQNAELRIRDKIWHLRWLRTVRIIFFLR